MGSVLKVCASLVFALATTSATFASPVGLWDFETGDTRVKVEMCGDGNALCGTLVWLKDTSYNVQYQKYLNTIMVKEARATGPNRWRGDMNLMGQSATGTIKQISEDHLTITGCAYLVVCKTYELYRHAE